MSEIIDIIDEHDVVIGSAEKKDVHKKWLDHRFVHVLVFSDSNTLVVQQRLSTKKNDPNLFDASAGGHVMSGELYIDAAKRELHEELGIVGELQEIWPIRGWCHGGTLLGRLFIIEHPWPYTVQSDELQRIDQISIQDFQFLVDRFSYMVCGGMISSWNAYKKSRGM